MAQPWEFHRVALPEAVRSDFDAWMAGTRPLASFIPAPWRAAPAVAAVLATPTWAALEARLRDEYLETAAVRTGVYPLFHTWFRPLALCSTPAAVRVILPAAEPYADDRADGLAFSIRCGRLPDTLRNMLLVRTMNAVATTAACAKRAREPEPEPEPEREPERDAKRLKVHGGAGAPDATSEPAAVMVKPKAEPKTEPKAELKTEPAPMQMPWTADVVARATAGGSLNVWAMQGVLLLNISVTVRGGAKKSHQSWGWDVFTRACCEAVLAASDTAVCLLLGGGARTFLQDAAVSHGAAVVETTHPCDLTWEGNPDRPAQAFKTGEPYRAVNELLVMQGTTPIVW